MAFLGHSLEGQSVTHRYTKATVDEVGAALANLWDSPIVFTMTEYGRGNSKPMLKKENFTWKFLEWSEKIFQYSHNTDFKIADEVRFIRLRR